jgi:dTDP-4-amino-4,6-dideoxygalactose transaminase
MINVTRTYLPDINKYKQYLDRIYASGWVTNYGELVRELECRLSQVLGVRNLILVSNGTLAMQVLYKAMGLKGEVITSPFSFVATTSSIAWEGLKPVFADIDPEGYGIDPVEVERKITNETSAIVAVHVFGNPCKVEELARIASKHNLRLIYDAAHAFLVSVGNKGISAFGDASTFSFHATKVFHTIEGGAIATGDDELAKRIRLMINFGIAGYDLVTEIGTNAKMNEFQAAMGLCVLEDVEENIRKRGRIYDIYRSAFASNSSIGLQKVEPETRLNYSYFPILLPSEEILKELTAELRKEGIQPRRYFYPSLNRLPYMTPEQAAPLSESVADRILCIPIYESLPEAIIDKIIRIVNRKIS